LAVCKVGTGEILIILIRGTQLFFIPQAAPPLFTMPGQIPAAPGINPIGAFDWLGGNPAALPLPGQQQQQQPELFWALACFHS
jgi:hypothetical protein